MKFYHFTSRDHLPLIGQYGLTVGDVPTDIMRMRGRVGVWFTTSESATGHGLEGAAIDKQRYRLEVEPDTNTGLLHKWTEWAAQYVTLKTQEVLAQTAAEEGENVSDTWYVFFGVVPVTAIKKCVDTLTGDEMPDWKNLPVRPESIVNAVPPWRRDAWQRSMVKRVKKALASQQQ